MYNIHDFLYYGLGPTKCIFLALLVRGADFRLQLHRCGSIIMKMVASTAKNAFGENLI